MIPIPTPARALVLALATGLSTLQIGIMDAPPKPKSYVLYTDAQQTVKAGARSTIDLRFQVVEGFHVNSHTPKSELLIPTSLTLKPAEGVKTGPAEYPKGTEYTFSFDPGEKLDVYAGVFTVKLPVEATSGEHAIEGILRYQACDHAACYPPKSLPVKVLVVAK